MVAMHDSVALLCDVKLHGIWSVSYDPHLSYQQNVQLVVADESTPPCDMPTMHSANPRTTAKTALTDWGWSRRRE
jgi:hypothetical protein